VADKQTNKRSRAKCQHKSEADAALKGSIHQGFSTL